MQSVDNYVISAITLIGVTLQPIFVRTKLEQDLKPKEISQHCIVYKFACELCDADYVGHIYSPTPSSTHCRTQVNTSYKNTVEKTFFNERQFRVLKKCQGKFDCLGYEMLFIKERGGLHVASE